MLPFYIIVFLLLGAVALGFCVAIIVRTLTRNNAAAVLFAIVVGIFAFMGASTHFSEKYGNTEIETYEYAELKNLSYDCRMDGALRSAMADDKVTVEEFAALNDRKHALYAADTKDEARALAKGEEYNSAARTTGCANRKPAR